MSYKKDKLQSTTTAAARLDQVQKRFTLTGFAVFIQLLPRWTAAVETSDGVAAESLAASVGLLTLIHI